LLAKTGQVMIDRRERVLISNVVFSNCSHIEL
jgi:hypothetical protein